MPILSGLICFSVYSCVEPRKACSERNYIYEKINYHHPRAYYDVLHRTEKERRSTACDRCKSVTDGDNDNGEQVPEESEKPAETAFVGEVNEAETVVEAEETTATESEVVTEEPEVFTEEKTHSVQETTTEECTEITEEKVITEPEEDTALCIDEGDQSLAEYNPQIGGQPNPFETDIPTEIDDRPVEDYVGEGEDRPGEGKHF